MKTYKRICIEDYSLVAENGDAMHLKRGKEYTTSEEKDGVVVVFTNYWAPAPIRVFAGEKVFTP